MTRRLLGGGIHRSRYPDLLVLQLREAKLVYAQTPLPACVCPLTISAVSRHSVAPGSRPLAADVLASYITEYEFICNYFIASTTSSA
jgi:hypothetical protein